MARNLDNEWLLSQAATSTERETVRSILEMREKLISQHDFHTGDKIITLKLCENIISMRECSAPASLEVYHEIFRENDHFLHKDFFLSDAECIIDVGANEGFYMLRIARLTPGTRIICIEPNPFAFEILMQNIQNNGVENVFPVNKAVTSDGRPIDMEFVSQIPAIGGAKLRDVDRPWLRDDIIEKKTVSSVTIEQIFAQYSVNNVDILKVDVEGMEDEIVRSLEPIASKIRRIVIERHSKDLRNVVTDKLQRLGFELVFEEDPHFERYYGDLYFINKATKAT